MELYIANSEVCGIGGLSPTICELFLSVCGYSNWNTYFRFQELCDAHQESSRLRRHSVCKMECLIWQSSTQKLRQQSEARSALVKIVEVILVLKRQCQAVRKHIDKDNNFIQIFSLRLAIDFFARACTA